MKAIFFDSGPIISLVMSRLIWVLPKLKEQYGGEFYITPAVKRELVEHPITVKRFEFEALQTMKLIEDGVLKVYDKIPKKKVDDLISLANSSFKIGNKTIDLIQSGEMEIIAAALETNADAVIIDERTIRLFIENNREMEKLLERRFRKKVTSNKEKMDQFSQQFKSLKIIRSVELVATAYKLGMLDMYLPKQSGAKELLLDSVLWATKYNGSAVTGGEIQEIKDYLLK
jgi:predicted nucleic acid-binding protein